MLMLIEVIFVGSVGMFQVRNCLGLDNLALTELLHLCLKQIMSAGNFLPVYYSLWFNRLFDRPPNSFLFPFECGITDRGTEIQKANNTQFKSSTQSMGVSLRRLMIELITGARPRSASPLTWGWKAEIAVPLIHLCQTILRKSYKPRPWSIFFAITWITYSLMSLSVEWAGD
jgi:hypothetical protein